MSYYNLSAGQETGNILSGELLGETYDAKITHGKVSILDSDGNLYDGDLIKSVLFYDDNGALLVQASVENGIADFNNLDINGKFNIKLSIGNIGMNTSSEEVKDLQIKFTPTFASSNDTVLDLGATNSIASNKFNILSANISSASFVDSYGGVSVTEKLSNGNSVVAIVKITSDNTNNRTRPWDLAQPVLEKLKLVAITNNGPGATIPSVDGATIERIGGNGNVGGAEVYWEPASSYDGGNIYSISFNQSNNYSLNALDSDAELGLGNVSYYAIKATISGMDIIGAANSIEGHNATLGISLNLNNGGLSFKNCGDYTSCNTLSGIAFDHNQSDGVLTNSVSQL